MPPPGARFVIGISITAQPELKVPSSPTTLLVPGVPLRVRRARRGVPASGLRGRVVTGDELHGVLAGLATRLLEHEGGSLLDLGRERAQRPFSGRSVTIVSLPDPTGFAHVDGNDAALLVLAAWPTPVAATMETHRAAAIEQPPASQTCHVLSSSSEPLRRPGQAGRCGLLPPTWDDKQPAPVSRVPPDTRPATHRRVSRRAGILDSPACPRPRTTARATRASDIPPRSPMAHRAPARDPC